MTDIRWKQRFDNYSRAFTELADNLQLADERPLSRLEKQGVIQGFEYTHELAWNLLKDYLEYMGHVGLVGSRDTLREAFKHGLVADGQTWMDMIQSRNQTSHAYDQNIAEKVYNDIRARFFRHFSALHTAFAKRMHENI